MGLMAWLHDNTGVARLSPSDSFRQNYEAGILKYWKLAYGYELPKYLMGVLTVPLDQATIEDVRQVLDTLMVELHKLESYQTQRVYSAKASWNEPPQFTDKKEQEVRYWILRQKKEFLLYEEEVTKINGGWRTVHRKLLGSPKQETENA